MSVRERILLMGPPGSGKSLQIIKIALFLKENNIPIYVIDLEDKLEATLLGMGGMPENMELHTAFEWDKQPEEGVKQVVTSIVSKVKPGDWIGVDRADLLWPMVQRWFTQRKYDEELADRMMQKSMEMKKSSMFIPRFDQGSWQVINEQYETQILNILYKSRCNIVLTAGIRGITEDNPLDIGRLGVLPRGQKELGHQPHSVFLLGQEKGRRGQDSNWIITTDKDLPGREYFEREAIYDFGFQYLENYYTP